MTYCTTGVRLQALLTTAALALLAACSSEGATGVTAPPPGPTSGWLTVQFLSPRTDDGAVQLSITGPQLDSVTVVGYNGFAAIEGSQADLVATGNISSGDIARILVPDISRISEYQVSVSAAAARDTYELQSLVGYRAVVVR
jgi:hypothetical protein